MRVGWARACRSGRRKAVLDFERRAEKLLGTVEARAVKAMAPVLAKTFATRREVRELPALVERADAQGRGAGPALGGVRIVGGRDR